MKVSKDSKMHLKHFSPLLICSLLSADELPDLLNQSQHESLNLELKKSDSEYNILRKSWINPLNISYTHRKNGGDNAFDKTTSQTLSLNLNQDVFRSGGIYYAIEYAKKSNQLSQDLQALAKQGKIVQALNLVLQIAHNKIQIQKQNLLIKNSELDISVKRELFLEGGLDVSILNRTLIELNGYKNAHVELKKMRVDLLTTFATISELDPYAVPPFNLKAISGDEYLKHNLALKAQNTKILQEATFSKMTKARFLPSITLSAGYNVKTTKAEDAFAKQIFGRDEAKSYDVGLTLNVPLNISTFNEIEKSKLAHLISKNDAILKKTEEKNLYFAAQHKIAMLQEKKLIAKENVTLYSDLLAQIKEQLDAGIKTEQDYQMMKNTLDSSALDIALYEIEERIELLALLAKVDNEL